MILFLIVFAMLNISAKQAELINIQKIDPSIQVDLVFATGDQPITDIPVIMYKKDTPAYICKEAAYALAKVQQELKIYGYGLKIRDAYRPLWAQKILWEEVLKLNLPNPEDYISDPIVEGGRHTRGTAVDLSVVDLHSNQEILLPPFCFGELAHRDYYGPLLTEEQIKNQDFIRSIMIKHGFSTIRAEWWHFDYLGWQEYNPLNIPFEELG
jgi:D-alanyl-D-alanine dipeptidase